jgi:hypothetical protein
MHACAHTQTHRKLGFSLRQRTHQAIHEDFVEYNKQTPWNSTELYKLYWPSDRRLLAKLVPTFCCMVSATDPHSHILGFLDQNLYYFI